MTSKNYIKKDKAPFMEEETFKFQVEMQVNAKLKRGKNFDFKFTEEDLKKWKKATWDEPYIIGDANRLTVLYMSNGQRKINFFVGYTAFKELKDVKPQRVPARKKEYKDAVKMMSGKNVR